MNVMFHAEARIQGLIEVFFLFETFDRNAKILEYSFRISATRFTKTVGLSEELSYNTVIINHWHGMLILSHLREGETDQLEGRGCSRGGEQLEG
jgi:hypothetical protein